LLSLRTAVMPKMLSRILMEKTSMEGESVWSTQKAVAATAVEEVVDDVTLEVVEVEIATGVDSVAGGHLVPGLDIACVSRTSLPQPPGRT